MVSLFICAECGHLCDSDDGCEEAPASKYHPPHQLLCVDCAEEELEAEVRAYQQTKGEG